MKNELLAKKRPSYKNRVIMVSTLTKTCLETVLGYNYSHTRAIADQLIHSYPDSFKDTLHDPNNPLGSGSLRKQLRVCLENIKRAPGKLAKEKSINPDIPEAHGCISWNPPLPTNVDDLKEKQDKMKSDFYNTPESHWDFKNVMGPMMTDTYALQRADLNIGISRTVLRKGQKRPDTLPNPLSVGDIKLRWPFLLTCEGMDHHFKMLTNTSFYDNLTDWLDINCKDMIRMLMTTNDTTKKCILSWKKQ